MAASAGAWTSFRQQTWLLARSGRWFYWIAGVAALRLLLVLGDFSRVIPALHVMALIVAFGAAVWAVIVWQGESPRRRAYHWSLPVSRPVHDLARVAAGAAFLVVACALWAGFEVAAASLDGTLDRLLALGAEAWVSFIVAPLIAYLLAMPFVLWSDYTFTRWLFGFFMLFGLLAAALDARGYYLLARFLGMVLFGDGSAGIGTALAPALLHEGGQTSAWWTAAALWLGVGAALTALAATYRPGDLRRLFRRRGRAPV
jgi:hypothetical protein